MMKKATLALTTAGLLLLTPFSVFATNAPVTYTDLQGHFAQQAVLELTASGVLKPEPNPTFAPNKEITLGVFRGWIKQLIGESLDIQDPQTLNLPLTRAQAAIWATTAYIYSGGSVVNAKPLSFTDLQDVTAAERDAIGLLHELGILHGNGDGRFLPQQNLTRGEAAVILHQIMMHAMQDGKSIPYVRLQESELPPTAYTLVQENKQAAGLFSVSEEGFRYVMVSMGEKPTTGYWIEVRDVIETPSAIFIKTTEHKPKSSEFLGHMITYPHEVIRLKETTKPIIRQEVTEQEDGLQLEQGAMAKMARQFDLYGNGHVQTVAVVGTVPLPNQTDAFKTGYLGVFNENGQVEQRVALTGDAVNGPVVLAANDVNGDGRVDLVLDSDLRGNGGRGVHQMNVFVQGTNRYFSALPQQDPDWNKELKTTYDAATKTWTIHSNIDNRTFKAQYIGKEAYDPTAMGQGYSLSAVDPHYELNADGNVLETKHWLWTGSHVHGIAILSVKHEVKDGQLVVTSYRLDPIDANWKVGEL